MNFLIYGANGYTGALIARAAVQQGHQPILAGRDRVKVEPLARELGLEFRAFALDEPSTVENGIRDVPIVLHCAGPFSRTAKPMADACLKTGSHYLDITGEINVFESMASRGQEAKSAGVMLMPGVGFDVVPSDCLAAHLKRRLPSASHLALAIKSSGGISRGTATTVVENLHGGGMVRQHGQLKQVPTAYKTRAIDFGTGPQKAFTIPWGDLATAYHSTGIPNIEVYMAAPKGQRIAARLSRYFGWALRSNLIQSYLKKRIQAGPPGPSEEKRARGRTILWGEASDDQGQRVVSRLTGPEGYTFTVLATLAVVRRVMDGKAPAGFQTPALAYGPDFVLEVPNVERTDV